MSATDRSKSTFGARIGWLKDLQDVYNEGLKLATGRTISARAFEAKVKAAVILVTKRRVGDRPKFHNNPDQEHDCHDNHGMNGSIASASHYSNPLD